MDNFEQHIKRMKGLRDVYEVGTGQHNILSMLINECEAANIGNVLLASVNSLRSKHDAWIGNQTDQITSANAKGFKEGLAWAISTIEHYIELEHFQEQYNREEAERIALQNRYVYDEGGNCDGFAR